MKKIKAMIVILIALECVLQTVSLLRYAIARRNYNQSIQNTISTNWFYRNPENQWWIKEGYDMRSEFHPFTGWITAPKETPHIHISNENVRKTVGNPDNTQDLPTIFVFGGSTAWGDNYPDDQTIPSYMAQKINANGPRAVVTNHAQVGFNSSQEVAYFIQLLKQNKAPSLAIFIDGCNDFYTPIDSNKHNTVFHEEDMRAYINNIWDFSASKPPVNRGLLSANAWNAIKKYIKLYYYPKQLLTVLSDFFHGNTSDKSASYEWDETSLIQTVSHTYGQNVQIIDALSQKYNFDYLFFFQPLLLSKTHKTDEEILVGGKTLELHSNAYKKLTETITNMQLPNFYDGTDAFNSITTPVFTDHCHMAGEGNAVLAQKLISIIDAHYNIR
jgi:hypothetical protein